MAVRRGAAMVVAGGVFFAAANAAAVPPPKLPAGHKPSADAGVGAMQLKRTRSGGFRHRDRVHGFEATIHRDGSVTFRDIARVALTTNVVTDDADIIGAKLRGSYAPQQSLQGETGNPTIDPKHMPYGEPPILITIGTKIGGIADILTNSQRTAAQRKFLKDTEEMRDRLARTAARRGLHQALAGLRLQLLAIWRQATGSTADKRSLLFALWDEAAERAAIESRNDISLGSAAPSTGERENTLSHREAGERARRTIEAFIRSVAPKGSAQGYSAEELKRLNATRRSRQRFDPYAT